MAHHGKREIVLNSNGLSPYVSAQTRKTDNEFVEVGVSGQTLQIEKKQLIWEILTLGHPKSPTFFRNVFMQCNDLFF